MFPSDLPFQSISSYLLTFPSDLLFQSSPPFLHILSSRFLQICHFNPLLHFFTSSPHVSFRSAISILSSISPEPLLISGLYSRLLTDDKQIWPLLTTPTPPQSLIGLYSRPRRHHKATDLKPILTDAKQIWPLLTTPMPPQSLSLRPKQPSSPTPNRSEAHPDATTKPQLSSQHMDCHKRCMDLVTKGASTFFFPEGIRSKDGKLGVFKDIYKHLGKMSDDGDIYKHLGKMSADGVSEGQFYQVQRTSHELDAIRKDIYKHLGKMSDDDGNILKSCLVQGLCNVRAVSFSLVQGRRVKTELATVEEGAGQLVTRQRLKLEDEAGELATGVWWKLARQRIERQFQLHKLEASLVQCETHKSILRDINKLIICARNTKNITVVRRRNNIFKLLSSEDVDPNKVTLSMTLLACQFWMWKLNLHNLVGAVFDDNVTVLTDSTGLLRLGLGSSGLGLILDSKWCSSSDIACVFSGLQ
nr:1-acyl-sn-glycerol-3-phosphate acyltransferase 1, chloroplastic-like isoform X1 [Ipomoea batatas]